MSKKLTPISLSEIGVVIVVVVWLIIICVGVDGVTSIKTDRIKATWLTFIASITDCINKVVLEFHNMQIVVY